jgi:hypothetical protein
MELSLERVADAVMALRVDLRDRPDLEKRQLPRFPVWAPRTIRPVGEGVPGAFEVWLIDIACGGIGFVSAQPLDAGTEFYVNIPGAEGPELHVLARIVHCRRMANGSFTSGAQFLREVPEPPKGGEGAGEMAGGGQRSR